MKLGAMYFGADMTVMEQVVLAKVAALHRYTGGPVRTVVVADMLGKHDRTLRYLLNRLEQKQQVVRVGQRGGWLPVRALQLTLA
jgi:predicted transcriptional regulator